MIPTTLLATLLLGQTPLPQPQRIQRIAAQTQTQPQAKFKLEPIAETKLIMEGLAQPNYKGVEKILRQKVEDAQQWTYGRGQALLLAETANLLMLRPPKNQGQEAWFYRTVEMRDAARELARTMGTKDYGESRARFVQLTNSCNRCHQQFQVKVQIEPWAEGPAAK
jgi:hypothetical protein